MRVVIDTNVLISYALGSSSAPKEIWELSKKGIITLLFSSVIIDEVLSVLEKTRLQRFIKPALKDELKVLLPTLINTSITERIDIVRDKDDNKFIETAVSGGAQYIVTGDEDLLILKEFRKIKIVNPKDFLELQKKV